MDGPMEQSSHPHDQTLTACGPTVLAPYCQDHYSVKTLFLFIGCGIFYGAPIQLNLIQLTDWNLNK